MPNSGADLEHLRLLSIFHYVVAGLAAMFSLLPMIHLALGVAMISGHFDAPGKDSPPAALGWLFVVLASTVILCGLTFAACLALAGRFLDQRRRYLFCLVVAGFACMFAPFGTVLGVFTIVVLVRPSVKAAFSGEASAAELSR